MPTSCRLLGTETCCTAQAARHALSKALLRLSVDMGAPTRGAIFSRRLHVKATPQERAIEAAAVEFRTIVGSDSADADADGAVPSPSPVGKTEP